jgi:hypothetical protein
VATRGLDAQPGLLSYDFPLTLLPESGPAVALTYLGPHWVTLQDPTAYRRGGSVTSLSAVSLGCFTLQLVNPNTGESLFLQPPSPQQDDVGGGGGTVRVYQEVSDDDYVSPQSYRALTQQVFTGVLFTNATSSTICGVKAYPVGGSTGGIAMVVQTQPGSSNNATFTNRFHVNVTTDNAFCSVIRQAKMEATVSSSNGGASSTACEAGPATAVTRQRLVSTSSARGLFQRRR